MEKYLFSLVFFILSFILNAQVETKTTIPSADSCSVISTTAPNSPSHSPKYGGYASANIIYVYICNSKNAYVYHKDFHCSELQKCKHEIIRILLTQAQAKDFHPCKICYKNLNQTNGHK